MTDKPKDVSPKEILKKALAGESIARKDAMVLMDANKTKLDELIHVSKIITNKYFDNKIEMCAIYPAKVGLCSGDCAYCAQSVHHSCEVHTVVPADLDVNGILALVKELFRNGVKRYSLVTSGEVLTDGEFESILQIFRKIKAETGIALCASLGSLNAERARKLIETGVTRYHHNIETSRNYFSQICSTHSFDEKIVSIKIAKAAGLEVCSGGIISMGESSEDRIDMAFELAALEVDCVPLNILNPISGTRLERQEILSVDELLRTIAVFRIILQNKPLRFAGGRENAFGEEEYKGFIAGINSMIVGNYLTTSGKLFEKEVENVRKGGFELML